MVRGATRRELLRDLGTVGIVGGTVGIGTASVAEAAAPTADFTYSPTDPKPGEEVSFDGTASTGDIDSYEWYVGNTQVSTSSTMTYTFGSEGDYDVTLDVSGPDGEDSVWKSVTVENQAPNAEFEWTPEFPTSGESVTFDGSKSFDNDGTIEGYNWYVDGDLVADSGATYTHTFPEERDYDVTLQVTDDLGKTGELTQTVAVGNEAPTAVISYNPSDPEPGETVYFNGGDSSDPDGSVADYAWYVDGEQVDSGSSFTNYVFDQRGEYDVTLEVTDDDGRSDTTTTTLSVDYESSTPTDTPTPTDTATPTPTDTATPTETDPPGGGGSPDPGTTQTTAGGGGGADQDGDDGGSGLDGLLLPLAAGGGLLALGGVAALAYRVVAGGDSDLDVDDVWRRADDSFDQAEAALERGDVHAAVNHYDAAIEDYQWVLAELPDHDDRRGDAEAALEETRRRRAAAAEGLDEAPAGPGPGAPAEGGQDPAAPGRGQPPTAQGPAPAEQGQPGPGEEPAGPGRGGQDPHDAGPDHQQGPPGPQEGGPDHQQGQPAPAEGPPASPAPGAADEAAAGAGGAGGASGEPSPVDAFFDSLEVAEADFQAAIAEHARGDDEAANQLYRDAREAFDAALQSLDDAETDPMDAGIWVAVDPGVAPPPTDVADLPGATQAALDELAALGVETLGDLRAADERTIADVRAASAVDQDLAARLSALAWWHGTEELDLDRRQEIVVRRDQADIGARATE